MRKMISALIFRADRIMGPVIEKTWTCSEDRTTSNTSMSKRELIRLFNLVYFEDIPKYIRFSSKKMIISRINDSNAYFIAILDKRVPEKKALSLWYSVRRLMKQSATKQEFIDRFEERFFH